MPSSSSRAAAPPSWPCGFSPRTHGSAWALGGVVSVATFGGFVLSRTVGLPGYKESEWELIGIVSLVLEAGYLVLLAAREWQPVAHAATRLVPARYERRDDRRRLAA